MGRLARLAEVVGVDVIEHLHQLAHWLKGVSIVHVNSTREGGGVAEILRSLVPLMQELGLDVRWEVIEGDKEFFQCTKSIHNALHGKEVVIPERLLDRYREVNAANAERLKDVLQDADVVFIHDPQPAALIEHFPNRRGKWIWRCHIDVSKPYRPVWKFLKRFVEKYDASIFHLAAFSRRLSHPMYLIPPSIDPLGDKNMPLPEEEIKRRYEELGIDAGRPVLLQVSRFDRLKDPMGVIQAYRLVKKFFPSIQLVLAGGGASDDPEGTVVYEEVREAANGDPDIHVLMLPIDNRLINALQRGATIIIQKSIREGFGLTVTEGMWKGKPVIGGDTGGIRLQVINYQTGFLVGSPEGAALRIRYLLSHPERIREMGRRAHVFVRENFLITRHLRDYLTVMISQVCNIYGRLELV